MEWRTIREMGFGLSANVHSGSSTLTPANPELEASSP